MLRNWERSGMLGSTVSDSSHHPWRYSYCSVAPDPFHCPDLTALCVCLGWGWESPTCLLLDIWPLMLCLVTMGPGLADSGKQSRAEALAVQPPGQHYILPCVSKNCPSGRRSRYCILGHPLTPRPPLPARLSVPSPALPMGPAHSPLPLVLQES